VAIAGLGALLVVAFALPTLDRHEVEAGFFYAALRFDQSLPLVGLGFLLAPAAPREVAAYSILLVAGLGLGGIVADRLAVAIEADFTLIRYVFLVGPTYCVVTGLALLAPAAARTWTVPVATMSAGTVLGLAIGGGYLGLANAEFAAGVVLAGACAVVLPLLLLRWFEGGWHGIAGRIFGSWLVAIGLMVGGLELSGT
jgi:hypothetical protein